LVLRNTHENAGAEINYSLFDAEDMQQNNEEPLSANTVRLKPISVVVLFAVSDLL
jgi:hypothetical protein